MILHLTQRNQNLSGITLHIGICKGSSEVQRGEMWIIIEFKEEITVRGRRTSFRLERTPIDSGVWQSQMIMRTKFILLLMRVARAFWMRISSSSNWFSIWHLINFDYECWEGVHWPRNSPLWECPLWDSLMVLSVAVVVVTVWPSCDLIEGDKCDKGGIAKWSELSWKKVLHRSSMEQIAVAGRQDVQSAIWSLPLIVHFTQTDVSLEFEENVQSVVMQLNTNWAVSSIQVESVETWNCVSSFGSSSPLIPCPHPSIIPANHKLTQRPSAVTTVTLHRFPKEDSRCDDVRVDIHLPFHTRGCCFK